MTEPLAATVRRWWLIANARSGTSIVIAASCRWMAMPPITSSRDPIAAMIASHWLAAGHTADASSTSCMLRGAQKWQRRRSSGWRSSGRVEKTVRGQSPDTRVAAPQQASAAIVADLFDLWQQTLRRISGKSKFAEAIRYAVSRRAIFERFLTDGRIELDSNIVERAIRPQTITRKNSLFAGSDGGGRTWATIATLLQTAKMNNVDPFAWFALTLQRIANGWPSSEIDALMPWNHAA